MCVVKTFLMMKRAETTAIQRRTSEIGKTKRGSGEGKTRNLGVVQGREVPVKAGPGGAGLGGAGSGGPGLGGAGTGGPGAETLPKKNPRPKRLGNCVFMALK